MAAKHAVEVPRRHAEFLGCCALRKGFSSLFGRLPGQHARTTNAQAHIVNSVCAFTVRFSDKIQTLMSQRRLTQQELGSALGIAHTSVGRWLSGSVPHKRTVAQLAAYFGVTEEDLLNDTRPLPLDVGSELIHEDSAEYKIATEPIRLANALARRQYGETAAGQSAFVKHLANLRSMRAEAEQLHPENPSAALDQMITLFASYVTALELRP